MTGQSTKGYALDFLTDEELLDIIKYMAKELGRPPTMLETPKWATINKRFGTFNNALRLAELDRQHELNKYTKDKLLELLYIEYLNNENKILRFTDIKKNKNIPSWTTIKKRIDFETLEELWQIVLEHNKIKKDY